MKKYDKELINQILEDAKNNHYKRKELSYVSICKLEGSEYYIIALIGDIKNSYGSIREVFLIKK